MKKLLFAFIAVFSLLAVSCTAEAEVKSDDKVEAKADHKCCDDKCKDDCLAHAEEKKTKCSKGDKKACEGKDKACCSKEKKDCKKSCDKADKTACGTDCADSLKCSGACKGKVQEETAKVCGEGCEKECCAKA